MNLCNRYHSLFSKLKTGFFVFDMNSLLQFQTFCYFQEVYVKYVIVRIHEMKGPAFGRGILGHYILAFFFYCRAQNVKYERI